MPKRGDGLGWTHKRSLGSDPAGCRSCACYCAVSARDSSPARCGDGTFDHSAAADGDPAPFGGWTSARYSNHWAERAERTRRFGALGADDTGAINAEQTTCGAVPKQTQQRSCRGDCDLAPSFGGGSGSDFGTSLDRGTGTASCGSSGTGTRTGPAGNGPGRSTERTQCGGGGVAAL